MKTFRALISLGALCALPLALHAAAKNRADQKSDIDSNFPSGQPAAITAEKLRTVTKTMVDSAYNALDDGSAVSSSAVNSYFADPTANGSFSAAPWRSGLGLGALAVLNAIASAQITDGTIVNADINASAAIALSKLATDPLARANHTGTQLMATISDAGDAATKNVGTAAGTVAAGDDTRITGALSSSTAASTYVPLTRTVNGHALSSNVTVTASDLSLGNVTDDAQTKAAIVPNTAPSAGKILVGNAGGTAYAPVSASGDATIGSTGVVTVTKTNGVSFGSLATQNGTFSGTSSGTNTGDQTSATTSAPLQITYTGVLQTALILPVGLGIATVPVGATTGQGTYTAPAGPHLAGFTYVETITTPARTLLTLSFDDLVGIDATITITNTRALTSFAAPALISVGGAISISNLILCTTFSLPVLAHVGGQFGPNSLSVLVTLSCPALVDVAGNFSPSTMALLTTFDFPSLAYIEGNVSPFALGSLVTLSLPALRFLGGTFAPTTMASCTTVSLASMVDYGSTIAIPSANMANVASVTLGTIGTLKSIAGATITLSGLKIPSANVNAILALLVSLDGTGGTTLWGSGKTINISGGTNGAPTGQGITDKATLQARGATVTTN